MADVPIPEDLPDTVKRALEDPLPEAPVPPGKQQVSSRQLEQDLDYTVGDKVDGGRLRVEDRQDPVEALRAPLVKYPERRFFYSGLLYGYCRIDQSITERYRAHRNEDVRSWVHLLDHPVVEIPAFPDFLKTRVSHILQSMDVNYFTDFLGFVCSNNIVDRVRERVWFVDSVEVRIPDPYMVDCGEPAHDIYVTLFCPRTYVGAFRPAEASSFFVETPRIEFANKYDPTLEEVTRELLNG